MKRSTMVWLASAFFAATLSGCGGGNDGGSLPAAPVPPPPSGAIGEKLNAAAAIPANDTATNSSSAFTVLQDNGIPAVTVAGAPVVNFAVFSDGRVKQGLTLNDVSFAIAKLVPGSGGEFDQWQSYVSRTETTGCDLTPPSANCVGPAADNKPVLASATQATTDPKPASLANQLVYNADGYYTYRFSTNITDPARTNGIVFEPNRTHRIAIQLSYKNAAGETVRVNPYFDVTFDANGRSVAVTNPNQTRVMADVSSCNGCHDRLALHGGGRVDVQFCVMCHNLGTTDANSGNVLTMATMTHKIHAGRRLASIDTAKGGEHYTIWGYGSPPSKHDYSEVGFPQDLRNCTVCHTATNPKTPQGDNWKTRASKEACLTCHTSAPGSDWYASHTVFASALRPPVANPLDIPNPACAGCHEAGSTYGPDRVHFNQNEDHAAKYRVTIESATYDSAARKVTVRYYLADPTNNNSRYNLVTPDCTTSSGAPACGSDTQFGNLRFYLAYPNMVGQPTDVTEFTSFNNGGNANQYGNAYLYKGVNNGSNVYTVDLLLPADTSTAVAQGTARVVGVGQVKEPQLVAAWATDPRPVVTPPPGEKAPLVNVVVQHTFADVPLSGPLNPRRQVVSNEKCNVCHGALGTTSGSNTLANAFHSGARNTVEACVLCHDQNRVSATVMTNGLPLQENYSFKRMIHGIHGNSKRITPFTHGNPAQGLFDQSGKLLGRFDESGTLVSSGIFLNDYTIRGFAPIVVPAGTTVAAGATFLTIEEQINAAAATLGYTGTPVTIENYAAEVAYPAVGLNCNGCHVNDSWKQDRSALGSVVSVPKVGSSSDPNPLNWRVITPKAATCTSCHDSSGLMAASGIWGTRKPTSAIEHVVGVGNAAFGNATQAQSFQTQESCVDCHGLGKPYGVDVVHK